MILKLPHYYKTLVFVVTTILCFTNADLFAQQKKKPAYDLQSEVKEATNFTGHSSLGKGTITDSENSTGFSGTGANIDVLYHRIYWRINPDSSVKYIKGSVQTNFKTIQSNVTSISFDLQAGLNIDSVRFRNLLLPAVNIVRTGNIVTLNMGVTIPNNFIDSVTIYYQGTPPAATGAAQGYQKSSNAGAGNFITTLSESYEDRDWWPCKHDMQDKIDSMDITVNVPWGNPTIADTFWVACNGKMIDSSIAGNSRSFVFKNRYPMASYLVFVSVAKYNRFYNSVNVNGTTVPVVYNLFRGKTAANYTNIITAMDKINPVLQAFSNKLGDYPFKNEKHGFYDGLLGAGGMEHQTFSGIATNALTSISTLAHELMHQWFGDNVSFSTWNDLWLAEGFANYGEALAAELVPALGQNPFTIRSGIKSSALATNVSAWIPDANIANSNTIWNSSYGGAVYVRGAMVVSMLRAIAGDTKFFQALTNYQTQLAGKSATTDSLKNYFNTILNRDIAVFFNDYVGGSGNSAAAIGGKGNPINTINWNTPVANKFLVQVASQTQSTVANVPYFRGPIVLHLKGSLPSQDTTINFFDWGGGNLSYAGNGLSAPISGNLLEYNLSFTPTTVLYDDSARTLSTGSTVFVSTLNNGGFSFNSSTPATVNCPAPASMSVVLGTTSLNSFTNPITLTATSALPAGTTVSFTPNPITAGNSTAVTLNGSNTLTAGTYNVSVQGAATGATTQTTTVSFIINAGTGPAITSNPASQTLCEGSSANFSINAATATSFQWQVSTNAGVSFTNIAGTTTQSYSILAITSTMSGNQYRCQASTLCGTTNSTAATLTVNAGIVITSQPANANICAAQNVTLCVTATGTNLSYQWQASAVGCNGPWVNVVAGTNACLTVNNIVANAAYKCVITSASCGASVSTNCATVTVGSTVTINTQPTDVEICSGNPATFNVVANSTQAINYQWQISTDAGLNFTNIAGANTATYNITNAGTAINNNRYRVVLTNATCAVQNSSNAAKLTVRATATISLTAASSTTILPGQTTLLTAATSAATGGTLSSSWFYNAVPLAVSGNTYMVTANKAGNYYTTVKETFAGGLQCTATSATVTITVAESNKLFISPSPNNGNFKVTYYNSSNTNTKQNIIVYDSKGAQVFKKEYVVNGYYTLLDVAMPKAVSGNYFVIIFDTNGAKLAEGKVQVFSK